MMRYPEGSLLNDQEFVNSCERFIQVRHDIHSHPELGGEVPRTAELVAEMLCQWGYETHTNIGGFGIVGVLKNGMSNRTIGLRADMDALPIHENTGLPYASKVDGHMHACGHDGHTAILLAAAHYLAKEKPFDGTINLIFQPDEEGLCGAKAMMDDGLFTRFPCDSVFGLHNMPGKAVGQADVKTGIFTSSSDQVTIRLQGKGGHAALPHLSHDVTVALGNIIIGLQTIVARNINPNEAAVVSIGKINAGKAFNVIPNDAELVLSVRNFSLENQALVKQRIYEIVEGQCQAYNVSCNIDYKHLVPSVFNSADQTLQARQAVAAILGAENIAGDEAPVVTGSEDFAWMLQDNPGCYFTLGNGEGEWNGCSVHNPGYDFNDQLVTIGAACWTQLVINLLPAN